MGELTEVASANRGVRGGFSDEVEDEESVESERVGAKLRAAGRRFSSGESVLVGQCWLGGGCEAKKKKKKRDNRGRKSRVQRLPWGAMAQDVWNGLGCDLLFVEDGITETRSKRTKNEGLEGSTWRDDKSSDGPKKERKLLLSASVRERDDVQRRGDRSQRRRTKNLERPASREENKGPGGASAGGAGGMQRFCARMGVLRALAHARPAITARLSVLGGRRMVSWG